MEDLEKETMKNEIEHLSLLNYKFGKLIGLMIDFHMSNEEKLKLANSFDGQSNTDVIDKICDAFYSSNKNQLTNDFKKDIVFEISKVFGYDFLSALKNEQDIVVDYFNDSERALKEEDFTLRGRLMDVAENKRKEAINSVNNISGVLNDFEKLYNLEGQ